MLIRKKFAFENAHVVRNCTSDRCRRSIHGHSYKVELLLEAHALDHGHMIYDFGLLKTHLRDLIDSFDHAIAFWDRDDADYIAWCKQYSARWVALPVSPSAEQFSRVFFALTDAVLNNTVMKNGEDAVVVHSVIVHETDTGYAQAFRADIDNPRMGLFSFRDITFSEQVRAEWRDPQLWQKLLTGEKFINPDVPLQVPLAD